MAAESISSVELARNPKLLYQRLASILLNSDPNNVLQGSHEDAMYAHFTYGNPPRSAALDTYFTDSQHRDIDIYLGVELQHPRSAVHEDMLEAGSALIMARIPKIDETESTAAYIFTFKDEFLTPRGLLAHVFQSAYGKAVRNGLRVDEYTVLPLSSKLVYVDPLRDVEEQQAIDAFYSGVINIA